MTSHISDTGSSALKIAVSDAHMYVSSFKSSSLGRLCKRANHIRIKVLKINGHYCYINKKYALFRRFLFSILWDIITVKVYRTGYPQVDPSSKMVAMTNAFGD